MKYTKTSEEPLKISSFLFTKMIIKVPDVNRLKLYVQMKSQIGTIFFVWSSNIHHPIAKLNLFYSNVTYLNFIEVHFFMTSYILYFYPSSYPFILLCIVIINITSFRVIRINHIIDSDY